MSFSLSHSAAAREPCALPVVLHASPSWLEQTQTWLYEQLDNLGGGFVQHVACGSTLNLDQFPFERLHVLPSQNDKELIVRLRQKLGFGAGERKPLSKLARDIGAKILHSHFAYHAWENFDSARACGMRHVVTCYGLDVTSLPRQGWARAYRRVFGGADLILCEGPVMAETVISLGAARSRVQVQRLGVSLDRHAFEPRRWSTSEPLRILMAASFREKKGISYGLEACARVRPALELEITIIGDANSAPSSQIEKRRILETIDRCGLGDVVRLLGYQTHSELTRIAREHHIFLAPSVVAADGDAEGGAPVTLIEMAASGMPIVSTRHCDIPQVVLDGETGLLAEERDVPGLASAIERMAAAAPSWDEMLQRGRRHIELNFDSRKQGRRLAELYGSLL